MIFGIRAKMKLKTKIQLILKRTFSHSDASDVNKDDSIRTPGIIRSFVHYQGCHAEYESKCENQKKEITTINESKL